MLFGNIYTESFEHLHPVLKKACEFLKNTDFSNMEPQKIEIDGTDMFAMIIDTKSNYLENRRVEAHVNYIDIQFSVFGNEIIGSGVMGDGLTILEDKLEEKDAIFYDKCINEELLVMEKGSFGIFFPSDLHRPCCCTNNTPTEIKKVVVKIKYDLMK